MTGQGTLHCAVHGPRPKPGPCTAQKTLENNNHAANPTLIQTMRMKWDNAFFVTRAYKEQCLNSGVCSCLVIMDLDSISVARGSEMRALILQT